jgi:hypothetical protein
MARLLIGTPGDVHLGRLVIRRRHFGGEWTSTEMPRGISDRITLLLASSRSLYAAHGVARAFALPVIVTCESG